MTSSPRSATGPAITGDDLVEAAGEAEDMFRCDVPHAADRADDPRASPTSQPRTLAIMHGSSFEGDGAAALLALADDYDRRLAIA